jgi:DNA-binding CsgD family transcriptional regulator/pimeloyl-ACP methyl ester carboxylesterase
MPSNPPSIRYARTSDGVDIAYWKLGRGPVLLHSPNVQLGHARSEWSVEGMRRWYETLARHFTVVRYDHRGGGLSSRDGRAQTIEALVRDIDAIAGNVSSGPIALLGWLSGGLPAIAWAAQNPSRVSHLVLWSSFARDAAHGQAPRLSALFQMAATDWELFTESISQAALGWRHADQARRWAAVSRDATTQAEFLAFVRTRREWDVDEYLGRVEAPTLILHDRSNPLVSEERNRELAAGIPGARLVMCDTEDGTPADDALEAVLTLVGRGEGLASGLEELSPREREVLALVVEGAKNSEIAERLFISVNTVTRHLTHIYAKLGVAGRAQAVRHALEQGLGGS